MHTTQARSFCEQTRPCDAQSSTVRNSGPFLPCEQRSTPSFPHRRSPMRHVISGVPAASDRTHRSPRAYVHPAAVSAARLTMALKDIRGVGVPVSGGEVRVLEGAVAEPVDPGA